MYNLVPSNLEDIVAFPEFSAYNVIFGTGCHMGS